MYAALLFLAISLVISGVRKTISAEKIARVKAERKKKAHITVSAVRIVRATGLLMLLSGILILSYARLHFSLTEPPMLRHLQKSPVDSSQYEQIIAEFIQRHAVPGMVVGIIDEHGSSLLGFGYTSYKDKPPVPVNESTVFELGSITKVFTGLLMADAVSSGALNLEDSVVHIWNSENTNSLKLSEAITLKHLVTHTAGLPRLPLDLRMLISTLTLGVTAGNPYEHLSEERLLAYTRRVSENGVGQTWSYSNYGFSLLGALLSRARGLSYEQAVREVVTGPLGMQDTLVAMQPQQQSRFATGYSSFTRLGRLSTGRVSRPWSMPDATAGAGGIRSTARDMLRFLEACLDQELAAMRVAKEPLYDISRTRSMGMGWVLDKGFMGDKVVAWHNGQTGGFHSYMGMVKGHNVGVVILANVATVDLRELGVKLLQQGLRVSSAY